MSNARRGPNTPSGPLTRECQLKSPPCRGCGTDDCSSVASSCAGAVRPRLEHWSKWRNSRANRTNADGSPSHGRDGPPFWLVDSVERATGIEPAWPAWKMRDALQLRDQQPISTVVPTRPNAPNARKQADDGPQALPSFCEVRRGTRIPLTSARDWMPSASSHFRQSLLGRSDRGSAVRRDTSGTVADDLLARLLPLATRPDSATPGHLGRSQSASSCTHDGGQDRLPCPGSRWSPRPSAWRPPAPHRHPRADRRYPRQNHATIWPTAVTRD
jgi:hypothetical protein